MVFILHAIFVFFSVFMIKYTMDKIIILDFGGQYCHLIARRIRDFGVFAEVKPFDILINNIKKDRTIKGIILSGGAKSVYEKNAPKCKRRIFDLGIPVFGICYGHQIIAYLLGGKVVSGETGEYGLSYFNFKFQSNKTLFKGLKQGQKVWMNHKDMVVSLPDRFQNIGNTSLSKIAAFCNTQLKIYSVQFHPEVSHTKSGEIILKNFVLNICKCKPNWTSKNLSDKIIQEAKNIIGDNKAIIGLSGGVDSTTAALLVNKAIGQKLTAVYVDTGFMRNNETELVRNNFKEKGLNLKIINAKKEFFQALKGITNPERKRKIIGRLFIRLFYKVAQSKRAKFLVQGTIYSDRIESGFTRNSSVIKSHHNVAGLPKNLKLKIYEPLRNLYKDEVRRIARLIGVSYETINQQVFPGPGMAIRVIGEITPKKINIVKKAGIIIDEELKKLPIYSKIWMSFPVLLSIKSVGIQGDKRSYKYPIVVRIVESKDAMTANFSKVSLETLEKISTRITNEIEEVNRVVYDITNKPPGTMEWE
jgi:GMP synthase (glutamine-hydrolysing)